MNLSSDALSQSAALEEYFCQLLRMAEHDVVTGVNGDHLVHAAEGGDAGTLGFLREGSVSGGQYPGTRHVVGKPAAIHRFCGNPCRFGVQPRHREPPLLFRHAVAERVPRGHAWNLERSAASSSEPREGSQRTAQGVDDRLTLTGDERGDENHLAHPCWAKFGDDAMDRDTVHRVPCDDDVT